LLPKTPKPRASIFCYLILRVFDAISVLIK